MTPFYVPSVTPLPSARPEHWTMHPELNGKTFWATYKSPSGEERERVHAKPDRSIGRVFITYQQKTAFAVSPEHIFDITGKHIIKPTAHQGGILAVRGPHVGKYMRRIYILYDDDEHQRDPWMTCMVFANWGTKDECIAQDYVRVDPGDCAPCDEQKLVGDLAERLQNARKIARLKQQKPRPASSVHQNKRRKK
ncbi:hypothetical protein VKT23_014536 [Stygiomarasmius scandens]|uniref:Uncharacterized protein n=1 Tax=Marasmiellus scandens TaxID=2682957 RepID=A0ABR1J2Y5_9AGAR